VLVADRVGFEANASKITNEQSVVVDLMAGWLAENDNLTVTVEGHADSDEKDPEALSRVRAQKVLDALVAAGVPPTRLDVRPFGATKPATEGKADEERAFNRRVEFFVVKTVVEPPKFSALGESVESASPEVQWVARRS
jgi:peptidoglycan-associated lipoprotein